MYKDILVVFILIIMMLLIGCDMNNFAVPGPGYGGNNTTTVNATTSTQKPQTSTENPLGTPKAEPHPMDSFSGGYEEFAQVIRTNQFFKKGKYYDDDIVQIMSNTNIIRLKVDGRALDFEQDDIKLHIYHPQFRSQPHGYMARHIYMDNLVFYQVAYQKLYTKLEAIPNLTYDAVINGENVKVNFSPLEDGGYAACFDYKDMYRVSIIMDDKEILDYIIKHLIIEEISVK